MLNLKINFNKLIRTKSFWLLAPIIISYLGVIIITGSTDFEWLTFFAPMGVIAGLIFSYPVMIIMAVKAKKIDDKWIYLSLIYVLFGIIIAISAGVSLGNW